MKGRKQKISDKENYPKKDRTESESYVGVQTFMRINEKNLTDNNEKAYGMLELILEPTNLNASYKSVMRNKGAGGIDKMPVESLKDYLVKHKEELLTSIQEGKYRPNPVRRVEIPKDDKSKRLLGIPTVVDRVIQQAISQVLTPLYEPQFSENSYGFRPKRNAHQALMKCKEYLESGYRYAVDMDLEKFFDRVNHSKLIEVLSRSIKDGRVVSLIHKYLNAGVQTSVGFEPSEMGVPQGGPLSPLLSNIMLNELDKELERRGHKFVRYADDMIILCKSKRSAERVMSSITRFLEEKLFLKVNRDKSQVAYMTKVKFLGYAFYQTKGKWRLRTHPKSVSKMKSKIKELTSRSNGWGYERRKETLRQYIVGWVNYFKLSDMDSLLQRVDEWYRRRLRMVIWKQWKRTKTKMTNLMKLGVKKSKAWEWANTRKGYWHIANSYILSTTITNERLSKAGYPYLSDSYRKVRVNA
jgi:group II intron reverse transcriptase/maturase